MSLKDKIIRVATLPSIVGGCVALASNLIMGVGFDQSAALPIVGVQLPAPIAQGICAGFASELAEITSDFILPHIQNNDKLVRTERLVLKPIVTGSALAGLAYFNVPSSNMLETLGRNFMVGCGSEIAGTYIYRTAKEMLSQ